MYVIAQSEQRHRIIAALRHGQRDAYVIVAVAYGFLGVVEAELALLYIAREYGNAAVYGLLIVGLVPVKRDAHRARVALLAHRGGGYVHGHVGIAGLFAAVYGQVYVNEGVLSAGQVHAGGHVYKVGFRALDHAQSQVEVHRGAGLVYFRILNLQALHHAVDVVLHVDGAALNLNVGNRSSVLGGGREHGHLEAVGHGHLLGVLDERGVHGAEINVANVLTALRRGGGKRLAYRLHRRHYLLVAVHGGYDAGDELVGLLGGHIHDGLGAGVGHFINGALGIGRGNVRGYFAHQLRYGGGVKIDVSIRLGAVNRAYRNRARDLGPHAVHDGSEVAEFLIGFRAQLGQRVAHAVVRYGNKLIGQQDGRILLAQFGGNAYLRVVGSTHGQARDSIFVVGVHAAQELERQSGKVQLSAHVVYDKVAYAGLIVTAARFFGLCGHGQEHHHGHEQGGDFAHER